MSTPLKEPPTDDPGVHDWIAKEGNYFVMLSNCPERLEHGGTMSTSGAWESAYSETVLIGTDVGGTPQACTTIRPTASNLFADYIIVDRSYFSSFSMFCSFILLL